MCGVPSRWVTLFWNVTAGDEVISRINLYWHTITVGGEPLDVAWFDHLWVASTYERMGVSTALFAAAQLVAAREREWAALYPPLDGLGFFAKFGYFAPEEADDHLIVAPLTGLPQEWPSGVIEAVTPAVEV